MYVKSLFKFTRNATGNALMSVIMAATAITGGMLLLNKSSDSRSKARFDTNQNNSIENIIIDIRTILSNSESCKDSMDVNFQKIGKYEPSLTNAIENNIFLKEVVSITDPSDPTITPRSPMYRVVFIKKNSAKNTQITKAEFFRIQKFQTDTGETCSSYEVSGVNDSIELFCDSVGGSFDTITGKCDVSTINPNTLHAETLGKISCEVLGGSYNSATESCTKIDLPGALLTTSHFKENLIILAGGNGQKTGFRNHACTGINVANGLTEDGGVSCSPIVCPKVNTTAAGSNYAPSLVSNKIQCQCQKNRGNLPSCGQRDPNSCCLLYTSPSPRD